MKESNLFNDIRFLREIVARTQPLAVNHFWPVTLSWGCVITLGYLISGVLGMAGRAAALAWIWPVLIFLFAWPLHWYFARKVQAGCEAHGVRPRFRRDLLLCWSGIAAIGLLWTIGLAVSGTMAGYWPVLSFLWGSLYFIGYVMNGVLLSTEWLWAAAVLLTSLVATFLAGPSFYWLPGIWVGGTMVLAGLFGRRNARRYIIEG
jgi:hypothetical protein